MNEGAYISRKPPSETKTHGAILMYHRDRTPGSDPGSSRSTQRDSISS